MTSNCFGDFWICFVSHWTLLTSIKACWIRQRSEQWAISAQNLEASMCPLKHVLLQGPKFLWFMIFDRAPFPSWKVQRIWLENTWNLTHMPSSIAPCLWRESCDKLGAPSGAWRSNQPSSGGQFAYLWPLCDPLICFSLGHDNIFMLERKWAKQAA